MKNCIFNLYSKIICIEYHWIYRFVVRDQSIQFVDESCGYIEQVDDGKEIDDFFVKIIPEKTSGATVRHRIECDQKSVMRGKHLINRDSYVRQGSFQDYAFGWV